MATDMMKNNTGDNSAMRCSIRYGDQGGVLDNMMMHTWSSIDD